MDVNIFTTYQGLLRIKHPDLGLLLRTKLALVVIFSIEVINGEIFIYIYTPPTQQDLGTRNVWE